MITLAWATRSDVGLRRTANEDSVVAAPPVFAVADGMGGHAAGDVASAMAVEGLARLAGHLSVTRREVLEVIRQADDNISRRALEDATAGMGTTLTGLAITRSDSGSDGVVVFNVGDSRSYLLRDGSFSQISHDHSVVQEMIDAGIISAHEAETHPERNVITRSLGAGYPLDIDWWMLAPKTGDRFLLCSDGLFKGVNDSTLAQVLVEATDRELAAGTLLEAALAAGGTDNISIVVVDVVDATAPAEPSMLDSDTQPRPGREENDDTNPFMKVVDPKVDDEPLALASSTTAEGRATLAALVDESGVWEPADGDGAHADVLTNADVLTDAETDLAGAADLKDDCGRPTDDCGRSTGAGSGSASGAVAQ
jgi:protein phosphatase